MRFPRWLMTLSTLALVACSARADEPDLKTLFHQLLPELGKEQSQQKWQEACWKAAAPGHETQRCQACLLMAAKLGPDTPAPARIWLLKQLERIGRDESVSAIAPLVADKDPLVRDAAIRALANNPAQPAGSELGAALKAAGEPALKVALLSALGFRARPDRCAALAENLQSSQPEVAAAAARALGRLATPGAVKSLEEALKSSSGQVRRQIGDALARCAATLCSHGDMTAARSIAELLYQPDEPARLAGLETLLKTAGTETPQIMLRVLAGDNALDSSVVVGFVRGVDGNAVKQLADGLASLPPKAQVGLLGALGSRRERAALPAVVTAAASTDPAVKSAAITALGGVGDGSTVPLLVQAIQAGGDLAGTARHSLETVFADGVDQALIETLKKTDDHGRRALYIEILDHRRAVAAVPVLLAEVASDDANIRRRAIAALGNVASPEDAGGMIKGLLAIKDAGERDEAARAVAAVCARTADESHQADPVLSAYDTASPSDQLLLLPVLGRIGGSRSLELVRAAVSSPDEARRASGHQALFHWPDSAVAPDLAKLAETTGDKDLKIRAVQELARVVVGPGSLSDDDRLALLTRGFNAASRNEDKRLILDRAREVHTFAAVKFAAAHMAEPRLASQAIATVVDLLHRDEIRKPNQAEADAILDQVIKLSKDKSLVERAKSFKSAK